MPRSPVETVRRRALIGAAIEAIHARGSLDVTVAQIARRAGVSSALAHHYFGGKEDLLLAAMHHLLRELGREVAASLRGVEDGRERLARIVAANFAPAQFRPQTVSAWLAFYVMAQGSPAAARLLRIYARRLHSNLADALARLLPRAQADRVAEGAAALIDGLYIRRALRNGPPDRGSAISLVDDYLDAQIGPAMSGRGRA